MSFRNAKVNIRNDIRMKKLCNFYNKVAAKVNTLTFTSFD